MLAIRAGSRILINWPRVLARAGRAGGAGRFKGDEGLIKVWDFRLFVIVGMVFSTRKVR